MKKKFVIQALWQSVVSAVIAGVIYVIICVATGQSVGDSSKGALIIAGMTFVVAFLLGLLFRSFFHS